MDITVTFQNGRKRKLKSPEQFHSIDKNRKALFVMDNFKVYEGYSDGEIDEGGNIGVFGTIYGIALPFNRMVGWCYESVKKQNRI